MRLHNRIAILLIIQVVCAGTVSAQQSCDSMHLYIAALAYLRIDSEFDQTLKRAFGKKSSKGELLSLSVSEMVRFTPLTAHEAVIASDHHLKDDHVLYRSRQDFFDRYYFEPDSCNLLRHFSVTDPSKTVLVFSRPFDNYMIAEVFDTRLSLEGSVRNGRAVSILFAFQDGLVHHAWYNIITF